MEYPPKGLYVFLVYTANHELIGAYGAREDADKAAKAYVGNECTKNIDEIDFWSWHNEEDQEVTIEMTKLQ